MGNTFRTVYSLTAFNSAKAASGELCVMVVSNYSGSTIDNIIPNSGNNATGGTPNAEFKGAGICSYNNPDYYTLVIDEVAYTFNGYGNASSRNAVGWKLMMGTPQDDVVEIGNAVARTSTASTIKNSQGAIGTVVDYSTPSTVMVGSITARDEFAVQALKCLLAHIPDPSILSPKEISYYCHAAYEWAAGMMTAAAKARTTYTDNSGSSTATTKQVGELETNTEKLLNNLIVAVNGISGGGGGTSLSAPLTLINGIGNPPAPEGLLAKKYLLSWNGSTYSWSDFEDALNLPLSAINGLNTNPPATAGGKILVFKTSLLYPSGSWGYEDLPTGGSGTIADGSVTTAKIKNSTILARDLNNTYNGRYSTEGNEEEGTTSSSDDYSQRIGYAYINKESMQNLISTINSLVIPGTSIKILPVYQPNPSSGEACYKYLASQAMVSGTTLEKLANTYFYCTYDSNNDGTVDNIQVTYPTNVSRQYKNPIFTVYKNTSNDTYELRFCIDSTSGKYLYYDNYSSSPTGPSVVSIGIDYNNEITGSDNIKNVLKLIQNVADVLENNYSITGFTIPQIDAVNPGVLYYASPLIDVPNYIEYTPPAISVGTN